VKTPANGTRKAGYVGLVTAAFYAQKGHHIWLHETDPLRRQLIASGKAPFFEPDLDRLFADALAQGRITIAEERLRPLPNRNFHSFAWERLAERMARSTFQRSRDVAARSAWDWYKLQNTPLWLFEVA